MSSNEDAIQTLCLMGLEKIDASTYVQLLQNGPSSIRELAQRMHVDRGSVYRAISRLRNIGIVSTTLENPTVCTATDPQEAMKTILERKEEELASIKKISEEIIDNLKNISHPIKESPSSSFTIIQGRSNIYSLISKILGKSSGTIYVVTTSVDAILMNHTSIPENIKKSKKNGFDVRLIIDTPPKDFLKQVSELGATEVRVANIPSKSRVIVENGKNLVMSDLIKESGGISEKIDYVFHTNSPEMSSNLYSFCERLWDTAIKLGKKPPKIEKPFVESEEHKKRELDQERIIYMEITKYLEKKLKDIE